MGQKNSFLIDIVWAEDLFTDWCEILETSFFGWISVSIINEMQVQDLFYLTNFITFYIP